MESASNFRGSGTAPRRVYFALGLFSIALLGALGYVMQIGARVGDRYVPLVRASEEVKLDATLAHLWFEEILSGDRHERMTEVRDRLRAARRSAGAMVEGGPGVVALDDPELAAKARRAAAKLAEFERITDERWRARQTSASGTQIDQAYDAVFREFIGLADDVKLELHDVIRRQTRTARRAQWWIIAGTVGLLILVGFLFARYARQQRRVEDSLLLKVHAEEEARKHLEELAHVVRLSHMSELVAGIAHEINQPLAALSTAAAACRRLVAAGRVESAEHRGALELIESEASRASEVVTRLRHFIARRESKFELTDINGLVARVIELSRVDSQMREASIRLDLGRELPPVEADAIQIQQVLLNLLRNACDATKGLEGDRKVLEIATRVDAAGDIELRVVDQGHGLSDEVAARSFDPFFTTKASGMGMGLALSHSIVTAHGGTIRFDSNAPEVGTTFRFTLPACEEVES